MCVRCSLLHLWPAAAVTGGVVKVNMESVKGGKEEEVECDVLLVCVGRKPYTENLGLEVSWPHFIPITVSLRYHGMAECGYQSGRERENTSRQSPQNFSQQVSKFEKRDTKIRNYNFENLKFGNSIFEGIILRN